MKNIIYLITLIILFACNEINTTNKFNKKTVILEIDQMFEDYYKDISIHGLKGEFKYLDDSSDFYWVPPGYESAISYDSVITILKANADNFRIVEYRWDTLQIFPFSNTIANYTGIVNGYMVDTTGVISKMLIIESGTLIKREDGWKLLNGQSALINKESDSSIIDD